MVLEGPVLYVSSGMSAWALSGGFVWVFIDLFSSPEELVQASALFWP